MSEAHETLFRTVGSILQRGAYGLEEIEALRAAAADQADVANCRLAGHTLAWLMQCSETGAIYRAGSDTMN